MNITSKPKDYGCFYEGLFFSKRTQNINLLEIGIDEGLSPRVWKEYFINYNKIVAIDIEPKEKIEGVDVVHGDATKKEIFNRYDFAALEYDFIIDDGSHLWRDMLASFNLFYPLLKKGGVYIMEDVHPRSEKGLLETHEINKYHPYVIDWRGRRTRSAPNGPYTALLVFIK